MKKIVSIILALAMFCGMATFVTAVDVAQQPVVEVYNYEEMAVKRGEKEVQYDDLQQFSEGFAAVEFEEGKWRYVDEAGEEKISGIIGGQAIDSFAYAAPYKNGKALVGEVSDGMLFLKYRNTKGQCVSLRKDEADYRTNDWGAYFEGATGIGDYAKCDIIPYAYNDGYICLPEKDHYAIFDEAGEFVADRFGEKFFVKSVVGEGYVTTYNEDNGFRLYKVNNEDNAEAEEYLTIQGMTGKTYKNGEVEYTVSDIYPFVDGYACIMLESGEDKFFAVVDKTGVVSNVVPCKKIKVNYLAGSKGEKAINDNVIVYQKADDSWTFAVINDGQLIPHTGDNSSHEGLSVSINGVMLAQNHDGKHGLIDTVGNQLLDFKYSGRIYGDGTVLMIDQAYKYHFYIAESGKITEIKIYDSKSPEDAGFMYHKELNDKLFNTLRGIYMGNAGEALDKHTRFIFIEKGGKYSYAKLVKSAQKTEKYQGNEAIEPLTFTDVSTNDWYYSDLNIIYEKGIINGKTATEFKPNDNMTYAEAIKLAACLHQLYHEGEITLINGNPWYQPYYDYCKEKRIIAEGGAYPHDVKITRARYMLIFAKALPHEELATINDVPNNSIPDVPYDPGKDEEENWLGASIYRLYRAGIVCGDAEHNCKPHDYIKRSEVVAVLARMLFPDRRISGLKLGNPGNNEGAGVGDSTAGSASEIKPLAIVTQPQSVEVKAGEPATISVEVEGGSGEYTYQWFMVVYEQSVQCTDNDAMVGTSTKTLKINAADKDATFYCEIKDKAGSDKPLVTDKVTIKVAATE